MVAEQRQQGWNAASNISVPAALAEARRGDGQHQARIGGYERCDTSGGAAINSEWVPRAHQGADRAGKDIAADAAWATRGLGPEMIGYPDNLKFGGCALLICRSTAATACANFPVGVQHRYAEEVERAGATGAELAVKLTPACRGRTQRLDLSVSNLRRYGRLSERCPGTGAGLRN